MSSSLVVVIRPDLDKVQKTQLQYQQCWGRSKYTYYSNLQDRQIPPRLMRVKSVRSELSVLPCVQWGFHRAGSLNKCA